MRKEDREVKFYTEPIAKSPRIEKLKAALYEKMPQIEAEIEYFAQGALLAERISLPTAPTLSKSEVALQRAMDLLSQSGDTDNLKRLQSLLHEKSLQPAAIHRIAREQTEETAHLTGGVIHTIKLLPRLRFNRMTARLSHAYALLSQERTFRRMDDQGRDTYLTQVMRLSERAHVSEESVCRTAFALTENQSGAQAECGYYLLEEPASVLRALGKKPGGMQKHAFMLMLAAPALGFLLFTALGFFVLPWYGALLLGFIGVQLAQQGFFRAARRLLPVLPLPRLQYKALPQGQKYLICVPTLLFDRAHTLRMVRQLSVLQLANPSSRFDFMLLSDFSDADSEETPQDADILAALQMGIQSLNDAYGARFHALHRRRTWSAGEGRYIGRERKRGALLMLNQMICGEKTTDSLAFSTLSASEMRGRYQAVITLDADTFLPCGAAEKLVCALMHPLQRGRSVVLQPRMVTLPMHVSTRAQEYLGTLGGISHYNTAAGDWYEDAFRRGTFMGKGVYEPRAFLAATESLPENCILSHDLLEGELAGARLVCDVCCYDGHPRTVQGFLKRAHRWTRGDWQLMRFLRDKKLDRLAKFKMLDNLRASLLLPARVLLLLICAKNGAYLPFFLALLPLFSRSALWQLCLMPLSAWSQADAIVRALWRQFVSRKKLLQWTTAAQCDRSDFSLLTAAAPALILGAAMMFLSALSVHVPGFLLGLAWLISPLLSRVLDTPVNENAPLSPADREFLTDVARDTLRFYRAHVNESTHFLPPDNVQLSPPRGAAMRTSPTNIGMYLVSLCAARKMELMDSDEMLRSMARTLDTLEKLPVWHGIPYNWYDLNTLTPMHPRFVSSVDAGNLCACLLTSAQCARTCIQEADAALRSVPARLDALSTRMQFRRLYDRREELFYIGYDAESGKMTDNHYDMMASEALLLSYVAIALRHAPEKHWWRLNRTWTRVKGGKTLLSFSGTMFEYLLPAVFLPAFHRSSLADMRHGCVQSQMNAVKDGPFGISEAGYARFDEQLNYAYKAFGVRETALDGNCSEAVRAPYAAALALSVQPQKACEALRQWKARGVYGAHGFFESEDTTAGDPPRVVCSHMAHHQGMILCAVCNALHANHLQKLLFSLPRMRAHLPLLNELAPRRVAKLPPVLNMHRDAPAQQAMHIRAEKTVPPDMHILSGHGTTLMISCTGHSKLSRGDMLLTRFDPFCGAVSGPQMYLRIENETARLTAGDMTFLPGEWRVSKTLSDARVVSGGCVDPVTGAVIYRVRVRNTGSRPLRAEVTMYLEPALDTLKNDSAHEAFSSLFITAEPTNDREMTITRRQRAHDGGERRMVLRAVSDGPALFMNDRSLFIGRDKNMDAPRGLTLSDDHFTINQTAEPCCALRLPVHLASGDEKTYYFALGTEHLPENDEQAARAFSLCAARNEVLERQLSLDARQMALALKLCARMALTGLPDRPMLKNEGVRALWSQGVSGDVPFLLITARNDDDLPVIRQTLQLFALLKEHGAAGEVILLLPEENNYEQKLNSGCENILMQPALRALKGCARILSDTDDAFRASALMLCSVHIDAGSGLREQLLSQPLPACLLPAKEGGTLPGIGRLMDFNGFGGFTKEGGYVIVPGENPTPAPWSHMLPGDHFGTLVCEQGVLYSHMGNSRLRRLTKCVQDSMLITPSEEYFLCENGCAWNMTLGARVSYEPGVAVYERAAEGLLMELSCFSDSEHPAGLRLVHVKNTGGEARTLTLYAAVRFAMGEDGRGTQVYAKEDCVYAQCAAMPGKAFFCLQNAHAHTASEGLYAPAPQLRAPQVSGPGTVGILQAEFVLQPGESCDLMVTLGFCEDESAIPPVLHALSAARQRLRMVRGYWDQRLGKLQFFLPDATLSIYLNGFLPYQIRASRLMLRAGFYQSGGAFGFRDQLQDMLPLLYTEPETVRKHLLLCASRQYLEGDVQHWWHPYGAGVRTRISDDLLFLPYVTARYVYVTGDRNVLKQPAPYLVSPVLRENEHDRYETAEGSAETEPLLSHCLRAIRYVKLSERGIPLMGSGDWNDGMDGVQGESAWLGFFYLMVLRDFLPLCDSETQRELRERQRKLHTAMQAAFCDQWFIRAWYPDGRSIGAHDSEVPRIDLISQCFAAFAGMPRAQVITALDNAWEYLHDGKRGLTKLLDPPFTPDEKAGYIGAYLPGVRENGGQYTHAVPWFMRALLQNGRTERAFTLLHEILPFNHSFDLPSAQHYRTEPYALPADVYRWGRGGWTWYTGSAAWLYDVYLRDFLGFDKRGNEVTLRPVLPGDWEEVTLLYHFGQSRYHLTASRDTLFATLDSTRVRGEYIELTDDGRVHEARFPVK